MANDDDRAVRPDLDAALKFVHQLGMQTKVDSVQALGAVRALIEELANNGAIDLAAFEERRKLATSDEAKRAFATAVEIGPTADKYALLDTPKIDCEALMPLCKSRCCKLEVTLSRQDLDEGVVRWDYGRPYQIRRREDAYCAHNAPETHACSVYAHRPLACRQYDCRKDKRIWVDFEARIPVE